MRTTASYDLFPDARSERALARARWLAREGRVHDAQSAYDELLAAKPELKAAWAEYFELLRANGRGEDALQLADRARAIFGDTGFAFTLRGAALTELGRYQEALVELDRAVEADPDLALVWHELGYAAYKLGDRNRALLALVRAFALEPHTDTLKLRGQILRAAGGTCRAARRRGARDRYDPSLRFLHAAPSGGSDRGGALVCRYRIGSPSVHARSRRSQRRNDRRHVRGGSHQRRLALWPGGPSRPGVPCMQRSRRPLGRTTRHAGRARSSFLPGDRRTQAPLPAHRPQLERHRRQAGEPTDWPRVRHRAPQ